MAASEFDLKGGIEDKILERVLGQMPKSGSLLLSVKDLRKIIQEAIRQTTLKAN